MTQTEALKLADALNELLESFEKDGKFCKSSSIRNELYDRLKQTLEESKEALAQSNQERNFCSRCGKRFGSNDWDVHTCTPPQPEQRPVVVMELYTVGWDLVENIDIDWLESLPFGTKLYAHPPVQKLGMTEDEFKNDRYA